MSFIFLWKRKTSLEELDLGQRTLHNSEPLYPQYLVTLQCYFEDTRFWMFINFMNYKMWSPFVENPCSPHWVVEMLVSTNQSVDHRWDSSREHHAVLSWSGPELWRWQWPSQNGEWEGRMVGLPKPKGAHFTSENFCPLCRTEGAGGTPARRPESWGESRKELKREEEGLELLV